MAGEEGSEASDVPHEYRKGSAIGSEERPAVARRGGSLEAVSEVLPDGALDLRVQKRQGVHIAAVSHAAAAESQTETQADGLVGRNLTCKSRSQRSGGAERGTVVEEGGGKETQKEAVFE